MNYTITLNKEMLETVMRGLGELPLKESLPVFNTINEQYIAQTKTDKEDSNEL